MLRELLGLLGIMIGVTAIVIALVGAGWWAALAVAGMFALCGGIAATTRPTPADDDEA